jgi:hypothetical protein
MEVASDPVGQLGEDHRMSRPAGWDRLSSMGPPAAGTPAEFSRRVVIPPFTRLARTHAVVAAADAAVTISLAGSLFFDISPQAARGKVALYLLLTMTPFAVVAPLLGPALDRMRGGRRMMVVMSCIGRAAASALMVLHINSLLLFPEAFLFLVFLKAYTVSKSALVPTVVGNEAELVEANSKLGLLAGLAGLLAAIPAILLKLLDVRITLVLAVGAYLFATMLAAHLPKGVVASAPAGRQEREELRSAGVLLAASGMAVVRATVGFLTFQVAFLLRSEKASVVWFGVVLLFSAAGTLVGNALGPPLRRHLHEERMLALGFVLIAVGGVVAAVGGGNLSASLLAGAVGTSAAFARLAFDAIVQRDAPDANRGRAFAQFETRFQVAWVVAAFIPVVIPIPRTIGFFIVAGMAVFAFVSYVVGWRHVRAGQGLPPRWRDRIAAELHRRRSRPPNRGGQLPPPDPSSRSR